MGHELLCPHCQARYRKAHRLGRKLTCKSCSQTFVAGDVAPKAVTEPLCGDVIDEYSTRLQGRKVEK